MKHEMLVAVLLALAILVTVAWVPAGQVTTLCEVRLEPCLPPGTAPVEGIRICWQNRCYETDAQGRWQHSITVTAGQWYEFVVTDLPGGQTGGDVSIVGVHGPSNVYVVLVSDKRVRFKFNSTPGATSGPLTITIRHDIMATETATPAATAGPSATPTMMPTVGPSPTATIPEPPTPDWPPVPQPPATLDPNERLPWDLLETIENRSYEVEHTNPPVLPEIQQHRLYWAALTHNGIAELWVQGFAPTGPKNWRIPAGRPETGLFRVQYGGDWVTCLAFSNMIAVEVESSGRIFIVQYGHYILAECYPGTAWEVAE